MGQRHNRRRTRPRSRSNRSRTPESLLFADDEHCNNQTSSEQPVVLLAPLAHTRHSWLGGEWQGLECSKQKPQLPHTDNQFAMQQYRFFGGLPGDDTTLCYNMLDYFGRLDYIDT